MRRLHPIDHGFLAEDDPIELLDGLLLVKEAIILDDRSEPEPDVCVVRGSPRDYVESHPTRPALIVVREHPRRRSLGRRSASPTTSTRSLTSGWAATPSRPRPRHVVESARPFAGNSGGDSGRHRPIHRARRRDGLVLRCGNLAASLRVMEQYADHPMDLADASLIVAAEALATTKVFTIDRQAFQTHRIRRGHRAVKVEILT